MVFTPPVDGAGVFAESARRGSSRSVLVEFELAAPVGDDALGAEAHQQDEREAEGEELVVLEEPSFSGIR